MKHLSVVLAFALVLVHLPTWTNTSTQAHPGGSNRMSLGLSRNSGKKSYHPVFRAASINASTPDRLVLESTAGREGFEVSPGSTPVVPITAARIEGGFRVKGASHQLRDLGDISTCADSVFTFEANFWVNLHLFLRAESRRRRVHVPLQISAIPLTPQEASAWDESLDAYDTIAHLNSVFDEPLISLVNRLAQSPESSALPAIQSEQAIVNALNRAAPIYRERRWPGDKKEDVTWIAANCADIEHHDAQARKEIAQYFRVTVPARPILVDVAPESGPNLAYTTGGPPAFSGHTVVAPQKNSVHIVALNTIYHEISHTMVDDSLIAAINEKAAREHLRVPDDLWHAITLYSTEEITKRLVDADSAVAASLDTERTEMFERGGWHDILLALQKDWQPYLDGKVGYDVALTNLVHDTSK